MSEGLRANYLLRQPPSLVLSSPNHAADVASLLSGPADRGMRRSVTRLPAGPISAAAELSTAAASPPAVVLPLVEVGDGALEEVRGAVRVSDLMDLQDCLRTLGNLYSYHQTTLGQS